MPWPVLARTLADRRAAELAAEIAATAPAPRRKRRKREVEDAEYAAMIRRMMASLSKRGGADPETLADLAAIATEADAILTAAIVRCHDHGTDGSGYSWAEIAARLGVSRQAVQQRVARQRSVDTVPAPRTGVA